MRKNIFVSLLAGIAMVVLIFLGTDGAQAVSQGIDICLRTVVPSLFPFFVLSSLLVGNAGEWKILAPLGWLFRIHPGSVTILLTGLLGGYPVGAKAAAEGFRQGTLSRQEANRMLCFCSQSGPGFIFGMAAAGFPSIRWGWRVWLVQLLSAWIVSGFIPAEPDVKRNSPKQKSVSFPDALRSALRITAEVCGWVILLRMMICLTVDQIGGIPLPLKCVLSGFLELTNGCLGLRNISSTELRFVLCSTMLSFGGCCVLMQTCSAAKELDIKYYVKGKAIQTPVSLVLSLLLLKGNVFVLLFFILLAAFLPKMKKRAGNQPRVVV